VLGVAKLFKGQKNQVVEDAGVHIKIQHLPVKITEKIIIHRIHGMN
jgi:hypothetical protein